MTDTMDDQNAQPPSEANNSFPVRSEAPSVPVDTQLSQPAGLTVESRKTIPLYANWSFWVLVILVLVLFASLYIWVLPLARASLSTEVIYDSQSIRLHVNRLSTPSDGFLVIQRDENGLPGVLIDLSPLISAGTYSDFYIPFTFDESSTYDFYIDFLRSNDIYVTFYKSPGLPIFRWGTDSTVVNNAFGKPLRVKLEKPLLNK